MTFVNLYNMKGRAATRPFIFNIYPLIYYFNFGDRYFPV